MQNLICDTAIKEIFIQLGIDKSKILLEYTINSEINGLSVRKNGDAVSIVCSEPVYLFRALGLFKEHINKDTFSISEKARFSMNGTMLDCSRGAVLTVNTVKEIIRQHALMGLNTIMLYTEDTYEIDSEPYFGYMRGRYTLKELQEIDDYAASFGIDMIPCIQTLAHLGNVLRWNTYSEFTDSAGILLVDDQRTYEFVEKMIKTCRTAFRSKRIHIGMDEAHFLGRGKYYDLHGDCDKSELYLRHLDRVTELCEKYEFRPMIWGDMPFRIAGYQSYTDSNDPIDPNRLEACIPETVDLIYWDYYSTTPERYAEFIHAHKKLSKDIIFSGGAWRWANFAPNLTHSLQSARDALSQCVKDGINEVFVTLWGDGGSESSIFSCWPAVQMYAECNFYDNVSDEHLASRFKVCTGDRVYRDT
jgi:hexosaminidase